MREAREYGEILTGGLGFHLGKEIGSAAGRFEDDLKEIARAGSSTAGNEIYREARLRYAARLKGINETGMDAEKALNAKIREKVSELKDDLQSRPLTLDERLRVEAGIEYVNSRLEGREWVALAITLAEPTPGLRQAPDLFRYLFTYDSPKEAIATYDKDAAPVKEAWPHVFQAKVISNFKNHEPKWGPEYQVPLIQSNMDWATGKKMGYFLIYMLRYEIDTDIAEIRDIPEGFLLNPNPEYEPQGPYLEIASEGGLNEKYLYGRTHWRYWHGLAKDFEMTEDGKRKVTAASDSELLVRGHPTLYVPKNFDVAYSNIRALSPQLRELKNIGYELVLETELPNAAHYYDIGDRYAILERQVMQRSHPKGDPFLTSVI